MKVDFNDIKVVTPNIWTEGREWMWMAKVWEILEKKGRTTYETKTEKLQIYMLAVSAAAIYIDYNNKVFDDIGHYETLYWNLEELMSDNEIFFLYGRLRNEDLPRSATDALTTLESDSRADLMKILTHEMSLEDIALGLYYSGVTPYFYVDEDEEDDDEDDEDDEDDDETKLRPFDTYDGYWKMISESTASLIEIAEFPDLMAGYEWLNENAYQVGMF